MKSALAEVTASILLAKGRGHYLTYCEVSEVEYRAMCREHFGGPWLAGFTVCGVPIRVMYGQNTRRCVKRENNAPCPYWPGCDCYH